MSRKEFLRVFATILMLLLGILSIYIGIVQREQGAVYEMVFSVGGAALFGASLAMVIELAMGTEIADIRDYLMQVQKFESAPDNLEAVTGKWFCYYLTEEDGETVWKLALYLIEKEVHGNGLHGQYTVKNNKEVARPYQIEAGVRGKSLVIFSSAAKSTEFEPIDIIPTALQTFISVHIGVGLLETWGDRLVLTRSMFSRTPLVDGDERLAEKQSELDAIYIETAKQRNLADLISKRFPDAQDGSAV